MCFLLSGATVDFFQAKLALYNCKCVTDIDLLYSHTISTQVGSLPTFEQALIKLLFD